MIKNIWKSKLIEMMNKKIGLPSIAIVVRAKNKYYPQVFQDECLYKI